MWQVQDLQLIWLIGSTPQRYEECLFLGHLCGNVKHVCVLSRLCHQHLHLIGFAWLRLDKFLFLPRYMVLESMLMGSIDCAHVRNSVNLLILICSWYCGIRSSAILLAYELHYIFFFTLIVWQIAGNILCTSIMTNGQSTAQRLPQQSITYYIVRITVPATFTPSNSLDGDTS